MKTNKTLSLFSINCGYRSYTFKENYFFALVFGSIIGLLVGYSGKKES